MFHLEGLYNVHECKQNIEVSSSYIRRSTVAINSIYNYQIKYLPYEDKPSEKCHHKTLFVVAGQNA
jgi:hypothetical protein